MQAADEAKQMLTYGRDYFNSPWNYMDCSSCVIIAILFLLHVSRLNHQVGCTPLMQEQSTALLGTVSGRDLIHETCAEAALYVM